MFDLKAKLLAKGLVTKEQVEKIDAEKVEAKSSHKRRQNTDFLTKERKLVLDNLLAQNKAEQYLIIRKWVDVNRLDKGLLNLDASEKFFITAKDNSVSWLSLNSDVIEAIKNGSAGVIAYMSNHGLTHAVVPREIAEDVGAVFPDWLKVLNDKN